MSKIVSWLAIMFSKRIIGCKIQLTFPQYYEKAYLNIKDGLYVQYVWRSNKVFLVHPFFIPKIEKYFAFV